MPYVKRASGLYDLVAGFVGVIGPQSNPNYFTGSGYSSRLDDAKVFRTSKGCFSAMTYWNEADYNENGPMGEKFWNTRRAKPVTLNTGDWEIIPDALITRF